MASDGGAAPDLALQVLSASQLERLAAFGAVRDVAAGDVLFREGDETYDFIALLSGEVEVLRRSSEGDEEVVATHRGAGRFLGELNLLTGQRVYLSARVSEAGQVLAVPPQGFRQVLATQPDMADLIFSVLVARRDILMNGAGARAMRLIGSRFDPSTLRLREFAIRNRLPHTWTDLEDAEDVGVLLAGVGMRPRDTPVVITPTTVLRHPTPGELSEHLGLAYRPVPGHTFDLVVVGAGPAGLAAAVYGASEGLDTVAVDAVAAGGQAATSSRIENYLGFPAGVSGDELAARATVQAQRLGAHLTTPCQVVGLGQESGYFRLTLTDGSEIPARAVLVATGARYRKLAVADLERFEGAGVYYAATELEARICGGEPVVVVGGGNSAGQAAVFLASQGAHVTIAVRGAGLADTMSTYLIERIVADPRIDLETGTSVVGLAGEEHLTSVTLATPNGGREERPCVGVFCFIGAVPATSWLDAGVARDDAGFLLTDRLLPDDALRHPWDVLGRSPLPFETSVPGVFAAGDVRSGSMKRVAAAVGEGSSAVRSVHDFLAGGG